MPTYQYACTNPDCGNRFELVQSFSDPTATECPVCAQTVRKVYGSVGVVFKGSGFYRNDSRAAASASTSSRPDSKSNSKADSSKSDTPGKGTAAKTESAPAAAGASANGSGASTKTAASA